MGIPLFTCAICGDEDVYAGMAYELSSGGDGVCLDCHENKSHVEYSNEDERGPFSTRVIAYPHSLTLKRDGTLISKGAAMVFRFSANCIINSPECEGEVIEHHSSGMKILLKNWRTTTKGVDYRTTVRECSSCGDGERYDVTQHAYCPNKGHRCEKCEAIWEQVTEEQKEAWLKWQNEDIEYYGTGGFYDVAKEHGDWDLNGLKHILTIYDDCGNHRADRHTGFHETACRELDACNMKDKTGKWNPVAFERGKVLKSGYACQSCLDGD